MYLKYQTNIVETPLRNGTTFPKITICSHSMHSRMKIQQNYPNLVLKPNELNLFNDFNFYFSVPIL